MLTQLKQKEVILDDNICLLKPLGYNYVSFYHQKRQTLVIFHPELEQIIKSIKVSDIRDYSFREDNQYLYTTEDNGSIKIYELQEDEYVLINLEFLRPLGFQQNSILCVKDEESEINCSLCHQRADDDSFHSSVNDSSDSNQALREDIELQYIDLKGDEVLSYHRVKYGQDDKLDLMKKFYILPQQESTDLLFQYYQIMINNKPSIKYHVRCDEILNNSQLKYSNYYLTRIVTENDDGVFVMNKQLNNCKIIRKIIFVNDDYWELELLHNYSKIYTFVSQNQKCKTRLIDIWSLGVQILKSNLMPKHVVLTKNANIFVGSLQNRLRISKIE